MAAKNRRINVIVDIPGDLVVKADQLMFKSVLRNLVTNSIKFTPLNGIIDIRAEECEDKVVISVGDTGIGMN